MDITDSERDLLFSTPKEFTEIDVLMLGPNPMKWTRELKGTETKGVFHLDYYAGSIELKYSVNHRTRKSICLLRYCSNCFHTNPEELGGHKFQNEPHLHIYKEGFGDRYAVKIQELFPDIEEENERDIATILEAILSKISVENPPIISSTLWS